MAADRRRSSDPSRVGSRGPRRAADHVDHDRVLALLTPVVRAARLELEDVEVRSAGRRRVVRILVDGEHGVTLDEIADVSRSVSDALDEVDLLGDTPYTLEVSSPGVDRPLTLPRHWRRNIGRLVTVTPVAGPELTGRITSADDTGAELDLEPGIRRVDYSGVAHAVVQVEFRPVDGADPVPSEEED